MLSIYDAIGSFSLGLSTWPIPRGTEGVYGAVGNTQTCTAQGFFNQVIGIISLYLFDFLPDVYVMLGLIFSILGVPRFSTSPLLNYFDFDD